MKKIVLLALGIVSWVTTAAFADSASLYTQPNDRLPGSYLGMQSLLNPNRFEMSHQMNFSYATNMSGLNQSTGLYLNTVSYKTDGPLQLKLHLGYKYQPAQVNSFGADEGVIPGVSLLYQFNPNHQFGLSYGINELNSFAYNYLDHGQKPFNAWYQGQFLNNKLQVNVNVSNNYYVYDPMNPFGRSLLLSNRWPMTTPTSGF